MTLSILVGLFALLYILIWMIFTVPGERSKPEYLKICGHDGGPGIGICGRNGGHSGEHTYITWPGRGLS